MAINYARLFNRRVTSQSLPIPGSSQVPNSAGGYAWQVDDWTRFDRFLILGGEGGTYYIAERDLVKENHDAIVRCIKADSAPSTASSRSATAAGLPRTTRPSSPWRW
jgi:60 kDa SS-A/Ro ribonucleoprotein